MIYLTVVAATFLQGFLSMGFQLVATRVLSPFYGSSLVVWAFVISTFLAAFSCGAILGGRRSMRPKPELMASVAFIGIAGVAGFLVNAWWGRDILFLLDDRIELLPASLGVACLLLFFLPVTSLSSILPIFTEGLIRNGGAGGVSTGLVYGVSTFGNIAGVMTTAFVLIPNFHTSEIMKGWMFASVLCFFVFYQVIRMTFAEEGAGKD